MDATTLKWMYCAFTIIACVRMCEAQYRCRRPFIGCNTCCCNKNKTEAHCTPVNKTVRTFIPRLPRSVVVLYFYENNLPTVTRETFYNISNLKLEKLYLTANNVTRISNDSFTDFMDLKQLDISYNPNINKTELLEMLPGLPQDSLRILILRYIALQSTDVFSKMSGFQLLILNINDNRITDFSLTHLARFSAVQILASDNKIESSCTAPGTTELRDLKLLDLSNNMLVHLPEYMCNGTDEYLPNLECLDITNNAILVINPGRIACLKNLRLLKLSGNPLKMISANTFSKVHRLEKLYLSGMAWKLGSGIEPFAFNSSSLEELWLMNNKIKFHNLKSSNTLFQHCTNLTLLNIDLNTFEDMSDEDIVKMLSPLKHLQSLSMVAVKLRRIPTGFLGNFKHLERLNIDGNWISDIDGSFDTITSLKHLILQGNRIMTVTPISFPNELLTSLKRLNLANNPFDCSCSLLWFKNKDGKIGNITLDSWPWSYKCKSPPNMVHKRINDIHLDKETCDTANKDLSRYISIGIGVFVIVLILGTVLINRNIWYIRYWMFKVRRPRTQEQEPLLGGSRRTYVIYHVEDRYFVHDYLRDFLEVKNNVKLYIWHRDGPLGGAILNLMVEAICNCSSVIVVVSDNFLNDNLCRFQLNIALDRHVGHINENVVFVMLESLNYKRLNTDWCVMLIKNRKVEWCADTGDIKRKVFEQQITKALKLEDCNFSVN